MATPPQHPNPAQGNSPTSQGGYTPNGAPHPAYAENPAYGSGYAPGAGYGTPPPGYATPQQGYAAPPQGYGAPQQGYAAPNPAYGQDPAAGQNPAYGYPAPPIGCRICGAQPAGDVTIRQHTGLLVAMRFSKMEGPLCRSCATAIHRDMTEKTLAGGWWSPASIVLFVWFTLLWNLYAHLKIKKLPQPTPSPAGVVLDQGKPVFQRPLAYVFIGIVALWVAAKVAVTLSLS